MNRENLKPLPIGNSNWSEFSQKCYTVDKTLIIKELIDEWAAVILFTRPRLFGKTSTLQMLKAFFEKTSIDTSYLFKDKKIWKAGEKYRKEQGKYPVIYLNFKDVYGKTWEEAFEKLKQVICAEVTRHKEALDALKLNFQREILLNIMSGTAKPLDFSFSLSLLTKAIHLHNADGVRPIVLIDEYDAPFNWASTNGYLNEMSDFMKGFLSSALKDNSHLGTGIMTGVMHIVPKGIYSGLNNLIVYSIFDKRYSSYFGFEESEVAELARYYGVEDKLPEIKKWYGGYNFADTEIYNPWSVLNYLESNCEPRTYWLDANSNDLITEIIRDFPNNFKTAKTLEDISSEGRALVPMDYNVGSYAEIKNNSAMLYGFLVAAGYLKVLPVDSDDVLLSIYAWVTIPNREIELAYYKK